MVVVASCSGAVWLSVVLNTVGCYIRSKMRNTFKKTILEWVKQANMKSLE